MVPLILSLLPPSASWRLGVQASLQFRRVRLGGRVSGNAVIFDNASAKADPTNANALIAHHPKSNEPLVLLETAGPCDE